MAINKWFNGSEIEIRFREKVYVSIYICVWLCNSIWRINFLQNDKLLDMSILKAFADDKIILTQKLKIVMGRVENIVGKGENAGYQHFLLFLQCFQKLSFPEVLKVGIVW